MTAAQFERLGELESQEILSWRFRSLVRSGFEATDAMLLATHVEVDLHAADDLLRHGCPPATALRILL
jgi:hypothetical protein